jgi:Icc-related predicted phosphoesterase
MMKILALSDLHGYLPAIPECDLLLLAGDFNAKRNKDQQIRYMNGEFRDWLHSLEARHIVATPGNHDFLFEDRVPEELKDLPWHLLIDEGIEIEGVSIYGTPWVCQYGPWAFMQDERVLTRIFERIPHKVDILLAHGPAYNILDRNTHGEHCGSRAMLGQVRRAAPQVMVHGHIHEAHGNSLQHGTRFYSVSYVNQEYEPTYGPIEIPLRSK